MVIMVVVTIMIMVVMMMTSKRLLVMTNDDILGVICDVDALSLRWRSPENCHDMFES